jgi:hypothetical protein
MFPLAVSGVVASSFVNMFECCRLCAAFSVSHIRFFHINKGAFKEKNKMQANRSNKTQSHPLVAADDSMSLEIYEVSLSKRGPNTHAGMIIDLV